MTDFDRSRRAVMKSTAVAGTALFGSSLVTTDATATADAEDPIDVGVYYMVDFLPSEYQQFEITIYLNVADADIGSIPYIEWQFAGDTEVTDANGIGTEGSSQIRWGGQSSFASATVRVDLRGVKRQGSGDDWVVCERTVFSGADVTFDEFFLDGGYAGENIICIGPYERHSRRANGQKINLIVPEAARLEPDVETILDYLAFMARNVQVGGTANAVNVFAGPDPIEGGVAVGDDCIVQSAYPIKRVWGHEYLHTHGIYLGDYDTGRWLIEAMPTYGNYLMLYRAGHVSWSELMSILESVTSLLDYSNSRLTDPDSWSGKINYYKGAIVLGAMDQRIRAATGGSQTMLDVWRQCHGESVSTDEFVSIAESISGRSFQTFAERYIAGTQEAPLPDDQSLFPQGE